MVLCSIFSCTLLGYVVKYSVIMFNVLVRYVFLLIWNLLSPKLEKSKVCVSGDRNPRQCRDSGKSVNLLFWRKECV